MHGYFGGYGLVALLGALREGVIDSLVKAPEYSHQREIRVLWNIGEPKEKYYRINAPAATAGCQLIPYEAMPTYQPGASPDEIDAAVKRSLERGKG